MADIKPDLPEGKRAHLFLSYNAADSEANALAKAITAAFNSIGLKTWDYQTDANPADNTAQSIKHGLTISVAAALILGQHAAGRLQGSHELAQVYDLSADGTLKRFFVLLPEVGQDSIPDGARGLGWGEIIVQGEWSRGGMLADEILVRLCTGVFDGAENEDSKRFIESRRRRGRARALLVGISEYADSGWSDLQGRPEADIEKFGQFLRERRLDDDAAWDVTTRSNLQSTQLIEQLNRLFLDPSVTAADEVLFYFSGHGKPDEDDSILVTSEMKHGSSSATDVTAATITYLLKKSKASRKIVILDCCYGTDADRAHNIYEALPDGVAVLGASTRSTEAVSPGSPLSPYTRVLIETATSDPACSSDLEALAERLREMLPLSWSSFGGGPAISLGRPLASVATQVVEPVAEPVPTLLQVRHADIDHRLDLVRQLATTLESLLALIRNNEEEREPGPALVEVIESGVRRIAAEMRTATQALDEDSGQPCELTSGAQPLLAMEFADQHMRQLADLPWELFGYSLNAERSVSDWLFRDIEPSLRRYIPDVPRKSGSEAPCDTATVLTGHSGSDLGALVAQTRSEVAPWGSRVEFIGDPAWGHIRGSKKHLLYLQGEMKDEGPNQILVVNGKLKFTADNLADTLLDQPFRAIVIEVVASQRNPLAASSMRQFATSIARDTGLPIIGICHQQGYLDLLDNTNVGVVGDYSSYAAAVLAKLFGGSRVVQAAHRARGAIMKTLGPKGARVVGIPVILLPRVKGSEPTEPTTPGPERSEPVEIGDKAGYPRAGDEITQRPGAALGRRGPNLVEWASSFSEPRPGHTRWNR